MRKILTVLLAGLCLAMPFINLMTVYANESEYPNGQTPSGISFNQLEDEIGAVVNRHLGFSMPGVAIVVVHEGEMVFSQGWGYANLEQGILIDPSTTAFPWASTSKLFVWTSVMQLVEQGLIDLDVDVMTYLPNELVASFDFNYTFTMRDLMNHTAGFGENFLDNILVLDGFDGAVNLQAALLSAQPQQIFEPGTVSAYSNFGTALAAYVVGHVSGDGFAAFERTHILQPAEMFQTLNLPDWLGHNDFLEAKAIGYQPTVDGNFATLDMFPPILYPQGGLVGTAEDLARFAIALTPAAGEPGVLFENPETVTTLFSPSSIDHANFPGTHHGFMSQSGAMPAFGHGGDAIGHVAYFNVVPETRFGFVVLANTAGAINPIEASDIRFDIEALLLGQDVVTPPTIENLPNATEVEGIFARGRSMDGTFLEFLDFLMVPPVRIRAVDYNNIELTMGIFGTSSYQQVAPHAFVRTSSDNTILPAALGDELYFRMEDGEVVQLHIGNGNDFLPRASFRSDVDLISSLVMIVVTASFFLVMPIVLLISRLRNRKKGVKPTRFSWLSSGLILSGTLLVLNNLISLARILVINMFRTSAEMAPHIWINYFLTGLIAMFFIGSLVSFRGEVLPMKRKIFYAVTVVLALVLVFVLYNWNFFVLL